MGNYTKAVLTVIAVFVTGCMSTQSVKRIESGKVKFVELLQPVKFAGRVFSSGQQFELVGLDTGQLVVPMVGSAASGMAAAGSGTSVMVLPIPMSFTYGAVLDDNLCAITDYYSRYDDLFGSTEKVVIDGYPSALNWEPHPFCFTLVD